MLVADSGQTFRFFFGGAGKERSAAELYRNMSTGTRLTAHCSRSSGTWPAVNRWRQVSGGWHSTAAQTAVLSRDALRLSKHRKKLQRNSVAAEQESQEALTKSAPVSQGCRTQTAAHRNQPQAWSSGKINHSQGFLRVLVDAHLP